MHAFIIQSVYVYMYVCVCVVLLDATLQGLVYIFFLAGNESSHL